MTDRVLIFDTTLRDGEQSPGATMTHAEKLEIAGMLDDMGVDIIEAGFPIASEGDFAAVAAIAKASRDATICGLSRANFKDIDRCWEAVKHAKKPRIHTFIGTSPLHRAIPNLTMDQMAERIHDCVTHARNLCEDVQWSSMDATRTEGECLIRAVEAAIAAGVFGVPSFQIAHPGGPDRVFWGDDMFALMLAWLDDPGLLDDPESRRLLDLPGSAVRRQA